MREDGHVRAQRLGELNGQVPETTDPDDPDVLAWAGTVSDERRVDGRAGAEEGTDFFGFEGVRDGEDELLVDPDHGRVAALGHDSVGVRGVVGVDLGWER